MILVTGGAGFIGSNLVRELNAQGETDILITDNLESAPKVSNLTGLKFTDYLHKRQFRQQLAKGAFDRTAFTTIYHQGACSSTVETDAEYLIDNNYRYSVELLQFAMERRVPFIYASSAAVYGGNTAFEEIPQCESPLTLYGQSKLMLDNYVRKLLPSAQTTVVGLRYFNVYGPNEAHKGRMSSVIHQFSQQLCETGVIRIFKGTPGYADGEHRRDFVYVGDVVRANLFFGEGSVRKGVFNVGTGKSRTFNDVARAIIAKHDRGRIEYVAFPSDLVGHYQCYTQADLSRLREAGFMHSTTELEAGITQTLSVSRPGAQQC